MRAEPLVSSIAWVAGTWWVGLTLLSSGSMLLEHGDITWVPLTTNRLVMTALGVVVGGLISAYLIKSYRDTRKDTLKPGLNANSVVTLGQYPGYWNLNCMDKIHVTDIAINEKLSDIERLHPYLDCWLKSESTFKEAFLDVLRVYLSRPTLSATTKSGFHGDLVSPVILVDHALAVANKALQIVPNFRYVGLVSRPKGMPTLNPRDPHYMPETFHEECPIGLIALTAFAHDIGKIKTFVEDKLGTVIEANGKHGPVGARLVTHIPSVMKLHPHHIRALTSVLAHYHACHTLPLDRDYRSGENMIRDDKTVAIMEIVIAADKAVCANESTSVVSLSDYESDSLDFSVENTDSIIWESVFLALTPSSDKKHINGGHHDRIGFKFKDKVFLIEDALNKAVLSTLGSIQPPGEKGGVNALTAAILGCFEKRKILCTDWDGKAVPPRQAIFKVLFKQPPENIEKQGLRKPKLYQRMIIIEAKSAIFDFSDLPDSPMIPTVEAPTLGKHRAITTDDTAGNSPTNAEAVNTVPSQPQKPPAKPVDASTGQSDISVLASALEFDSDNPLAAPASSKPTKPAKQSGGGSGKGKGATRKNGPSGVPIKPPSPATQSQLESGQSEGAVSFGLTIADLRAHIPAISVVLNDLSTKKSTDQKVILSEWEGKPCLMTRLDGMAGIYPAIEWDLPATQEIIYKNKTQLILHKNSAGKLILVLTL